MIERFVSEDLLDEVPRPLINFIWYLWDVYCDEAGDEGESLFVLEPGEAGQRVTLQRTGKTVEQDFGTEVAAVILVRKKGMKRCMSRK